MYNVCNGMNNVHSVMQCIALWQLCNRYIHIILLRFLSFPVFSEHIHLKNFLIPPLLFNCRAPDQIFTLNLTHLMSIDTAGIS